MRKILYTLFAVIGAAAVAIGLTLSFAGTASATQTHHLTPMERYRAMTHEASFMSTVGTVTGQYLGGYVASGQLRLTNVRANPVDMPNLDGYTSAGGPAGSVAEGVTLAPTTSSDTTDYGIGLVWNAVTVKGTCSLGATYKPGPTVTSEGTCSNGTTPLTSPLEDSTCASDQYTLEAGEGVPSAAGDPVPLGALSPDNAQIFGEDVCVSIGGSDMFSVYQSTGAHEMQFAATPPGTGAIPQADQSVLSHIFSINTQFYAAGAGVDVSSGVNAGLLPTGTLADLGGIGTGLSYVGNATHHADGSHQTRIQFDDDPTFEVNATVSGNAESPSNPYTLVPSGFGSGSSFTVTVP
jgi:hypothetical protein